MKHGRNINVKEYSTFRKDKKGGGGVVLNMKITLICLDIYL